MNSLQQFKQAFIALLKMTLREKQAWFWGIFFPIILMTIFMVVFNNDGDNEIEAELVIVETNPNPLSQQTISILQNIPMIHLQSEQPLKKDAAIELVKKNEIDGAIILPPSENNPAFTLIVNKEKEQEVTTQMVGGVLNQIVQQMNFQEAGVTPSYHVQFESVSTGNDNLKFTDFLLTGMIALAIAQGGLFGMVGLLELRNKGILKRLRMTPAKISYFGLGEMLIRFLFSIIQVISLSLIGVFIFGANLYINFISFIVVFVIGVLSFTAIGYFITSFSKTTEAYMAVANIISFIMMFLSGIFFPIDMVPSWIQPVSHILPLTYFAEGLRDSLIYNASILSGDYWIGLLNMFLWGSIAFVLGIVLYNRKSITAAR